MEYVTATAHREAAPNVVLLQVVGCDWMIESTAREDQCGVCHGDGTTCTTVTQHFDTQLGVGYVEATIIPAGTVPQCAVRTRCAKKPDCF